MNTDAEVLSGRMVASTRRLHATFSPGRPKGGTPNVAATRYGKVWSGIPAAFSGAGTTRMASRKKRRSRVEPFLGLESWRKRV
jgi:hypothetical protein